MRKKSKSLSYSAGGVWSTTECHDNEEMEDIKQYEEKIQTKVNLRFDKILTFPMSHTMLSESHSHSQELILHSESSSSDVTTALCGEEIEIETSSVGQTDSCLCSDNSSLSADDDTGSEFTVKPQPQTPSSNVIDTHTVEHRESELCNHTLTVPSEHGDNSVTVKSEECGSLDLNSFQMHGDSQTTTKDLNVNLIATDFPSVEDLSNHRSLDVQQSDTDKSAVEMTTSQERDSCTCAPSEVCT